MSVHSLSEIEQILKDQHDEVVSLVDYITGDLGMTIADFMNEIQSIAGGHISVNDSPMILTRESFAAVQSMLEDPPENEARDRLMRTPTPWDR